MRTAIFNSFSFHYEMFGHILDYFKENSLKPDVYTTTAENGGWLAHYETTYGVTEWHPIQSFNPSEYDTVFVLTDDDPAYNPAWSTLTHVVIIEHSSKRQLGHPAHCTLQTRLFVNRTAPNTDTWITPVWNNMQQNEKYDALTVFAVGNTAVYAEAVLPILFANFTDIQFILVDRNITAGITNNVTRYNNIDARIMLEVAAKSHYILFWPTTGYALQHKHDSLSASIPLAYSVGTPLLLPDDFAEALRFQHRGIMSLSLYRPVTLQKPDAAMISQCMEQRSQLLERRNKIYGSIMNAPKIIYRISDGGYSKQKPPFVYNKKDMFQHFLSVFKGYDIYVVADNVTEETYDFLCRYIRAGKIYRTNLGNAGSCMFSLEKAIHNFTDATRVYFAEDDYIYTNNAPYIIFEGLDIADYTSGYDHPDKYVNGHSGGNPFVTEGGEMTRVVISKHHHWKLTNSTCMTFAAQIHTLKEDYDIFKKYCEGKPHPYDFELWTELIQLKKRRLATSIPGVSTHGESLYLTPFVNWDHQYAHSIEKNTALIIEPRNLDKLPSIIERFHTILGITWKIVFYCGHGLVNMWKDKISTSVEIRELGATNFNGAEYSDFTKDAALWKSLYGEHVLVFQADTWVMNMEPYTIDFFMKLNKSYIGGNMCYDWRELDFISLQNRPSHKNFNGGLSLRKRQHMINIIEAFPPHKTLAYATNMENSMEDVYFTLGCYKLGYPVGDDAASGHFAIHTIFHDRFFGIHQINNHTRSELHKLIPEIIEHPYLG